MWLMTIAINRRSHRVNIVAGVLALWPIGVIAIVPFGVVSDDTIILSTLAVVGLSSAAAIWGLIRRQWLLPLCAMALNILFAGTGYLFMVTMIVDLFRD